MKFKKLNESFNVDTVQKRIARTDEFDNGNVFFEYQKMTSEEAEEQARLLSIKNPDKVYYVKYDDIMNPCSDIKWKNGEKINECSESEIIDEDVEAVPNQNNNMIITVLSHLNQDGFSVSIVDAEGNEIFNRTYHYGYTASHSRKWAELYPDKPFVADIVNDLKNEFNVSDVVIQSGENVFSGKNVSDAEVRRFEAKLREDYIDEDVELETGERVVKKTTNDNLVAKQDGKYEVVDNDNNTVATVNANNDADAMKKYSTKQFNEERLTEGPLKKLVRGIQNKIDPEGAVKRSIDDTNSSIIKNQRRAYVVLAKDFDTSAKKYRFYPEGEFRKYMDWDTWRSTYGGLTPEDPKYKEWYNAIVTDDLGRFVRRGAEDLRADKMMMKPGFNTKIVKGYEFNIENIKTASEKSKKKSNSKSEQQSDNSKTDNNEQNKEKISIDENDLQKFILLSRMTGMQIVDSDGAEVTDPEASLNLDNIKQYSVKAGPRATYHITQWIKSAKKKNLMEKMIEEQKIDESVYSYELCGGELVNFGAYGELYVCDPSYSEDYYWVTDKEEDRYNKHATGWPIEKYLAVEIIDDDDEDMDESFNTSKYDFISGEEVLNGMFGNMDDKEFDRQQKELRRIARMLNLKRSDDLVCFVDYEWIFDPSAFDDTVWAITEVPQLLTVDNISVVAQTINGNIWLYFNNEADAERYIEYVESTI